MLRYQSPEPQGRRLVREGADTLKRTGRPVPLDGASGDDFKTFPMHPHTLKETQHAARAAPLPALLQEPFLARHFPGRAAPYKCPIVVVCSRLSEPSGPVCREGARNRCLSLLPTITHAAAGNPRLSAAGSLRRRPSAAQPARRLATTEPAARVLATQVILGSNLANVVSVK